MEVIYNNIRSDSLRLTRDGSFHKKMTPSLYPWCVGFNSRTYHLPVEVHTFHLGKINIPMTHTVGILQILWMG